MICKKCGKELPEGVSVCPFCGAETEYESENLTENVYEQEVFSDGVFSPLRRQEFHEIFIAHERKMFESGQDGEAAVKSDEPTVTQDDENSGLQPLGNVESETDIDAVQEKAIPFSDDEEYAAPFSDEINEAHTVADSAKTDEKSEELQSLFSESETEAEPVPNSEKEEIPFAGEEAEEEKGINGKTLDKPYSDGEYDKTFDRAETDEFEVPTAQNVEKRPDPKPVKAVRESKKARRAALFIKLTAVLCATAVVALTVISAVTDVFKSTEGVDKTMALTSLSAEEKASFELAAPSYCALFELGYDADETTYADILPYIRPDSDSGLYAGFFEKVQPITDSSDPIGRFVSGDAYAYTSVESEKVHKIASALGLTSFDDANCADYYYFNGMYYFTCADDGEQGIEKPQVRVTSSKKTQDGKYYIVCSLYPADAVADEKGSFTVEPTGSVYILAEYEKAGEEYEWTAIEISSQPLFSDAGTKIENTDENKLSFEMRRRTYRAKTTAGETYATYVIEYPYFTTDGVTQTTINTLYLQMLKTYKSEAAKADEMYEKYEQSGADMSALPLYTHVVSIVTYNDNGYLSLLERKTSNNPLDSDGSETSETTVVSHSETTENSDAVKVSFAKTTYEGYTVDIQTGDFVLKDDILGKNYQTISSLLFETYMGIEPADSDTQTTDAYGNPISSGSAAVEDKENIGQAIYSSAWVLTENGVGFCYQPENYYLDLVVLGYDRLEKDIFQADNQE